MLSLFPIQFLAPLAYLFMRVTVGIILLSLAKQAISNRTSLKEVFTFSFFPYGMFFVWYLSIIEIGIGIMLIVGFQTQIAALLLMFLSLKFIVMHRRFKHPHLPQRLSYVLLFICAVSLFITGAGALAFDLQI